MTNADKYLKDGVDINEFSWEIYKYLRWEEEKNGNAGRQDILNFFEEQVKPTLTEDERVILRNIDKHFYTRIFRNECLFLRGEHTGDLVFTQYDHLFRFIKERRRISDRGAIK